MSWGLLSICQDTCRNKGNLAMEVPLVSAMEGEPSFVGDAFKSPPKTLHTVGIAVCSGATVMNDGIPVGRWADRLWETSKASLVLTSACFWNPGGVLEAPLRFSSGAYGNIVIGSRDPYTHKRLSDAGIATEFVGCTSLRFTRKEGDRRWIGLGFSRHSPEGQVGWLAKVAGESGKLARIYVQDPRESAAARMLRERLGGAPVVFIGDLTTVPAWENEFSHLAFCVSGRLHQILPAAAMGVPSALFSTSLRLLGDSRFSLLHHLGIPCSSLTSHSPDVVLTRCSSGLEARKSELLGRLAAFLSRANALASRVV